ncbi:MAG: 23S rRNA (adenine(2503)-C(2))-methyltransferase RlmN [Candidatus Marinimicrobia bacterium]|nr:23S rRNA (adenine(2503)-C(2))-methyltransferase RlmN [Candidatus Neomarinimicrobiota bacterium]
MCKTANLENSVLIGKTNEELESLVLKLGEKPFRGRQLFDWLYRQKIHNLEKMTDLPKLFRDTLQKGWTVHPLEEVNKIISKTQNTKKFVFQRLDGKQIESVLIKKDNRTTVCLSTQVGCSLDCGFCATAKMGFNGNLSVGEILDQYLRLERISLDPITNIVFMGMGEPFSNYTNTINAAKMLNDSNGINLGAGRITISTVGIIPKIKKFTDDREPYKLAVSLNATTQKQREKIMPITKVYLLRDLLEISNYYTRISGKYITFEYVLLNNFNDTEEDAMRLLSILRNIKCKLNLIPYNEVDGIYTRPNGDKIKLFLSFLKNADFPITVRWSKGTKIAAGCGQLASKGLN